MSEKISQAKTKVKEKATAKVAAVKRESKRVKEKVKPQNPNTVTTNRLHLLITVVGRNKSEFYTDLLQSFDVNMQTVLLAHGTADAKMLVYLGLSESDKAVILSVIQEKKIPEATRVLEEKFRTIKDGNGIAFTIPLTSVIGTLIFGFLSNNRAVKEGK